MKYDKDDAAELMVSIMNMMIKTQRYPEAWKECKVVMLPKPCNDKEKVDKKTGD
jgi:hypothetical protein